MSQQSTALGTRQMIDILSRRVLKAYLGRFKIKIDSIDWKNDSSDNVHDKIYNEYLTHADKEEWYKFCSILYDISLVANAQKNNRSFLIETIHKAGMFSKFQADIAQPASIELHSLIAWVFLNMKPLWNEISQDAYNDQIQSGGRKIYIKPHPTPLSKEKRLERFKDMFCTYMTNHRSLVKNVHVEKDPYGRVVRFIVYHDPSPKTHNEFDKQGELGTAMDKKVEYFCILYNKNAEQPYISIKGEWLTRQEMECVAEFFVTLYLGGEVTTKRVEQYDMSRFNVGKLILPEHPEVVSYRPCLVNVRTEHPNGFIESTTLTCNTGDVYESCLNPYCESKDIRTSWRHFKEVRLEVTIYTGKPAPLQTGLFGGELPSFDRPLATYEVKITRTNRTVLKCRNDADRQKIESILDEWGIRNLNNSAEAHPTESAA